MVKRNSLLGRALAAQAALRKDLPGYGALLAKIEMSDQAGQEFDRVIKAKRVPGDALAAKLLHLVVMTALEASMAAPRGRAEGKQQASALVERRAEIEAYHGKLFAALDLLDDAFGEPGYRILSTSEDASETDGDPHPVADASPELQAAVDAWRVASGNAESTANDPLALALLDDARFQAVGAPAALRALREHLVLRRRRHLGSLGDFPDSRKQGDGADPRAFAAILAKRLKDLVGSRQVEFVAVMTDILYGGDDNVVTFEATRQRFYRADERDASGRS